MSFGEDTSEMCLFNVKDGFLEAVVRGYKLGLLTTADYNNLCQCETLEDIKLYLTGTDYGPFLANEASPIHTTTLVDCCTRKLVADWRYLRENAGEPLGRFLDYCTYGHMIDNVVLIVTGSLHERDVQELLEKCNPLGMFDAIASLAVAQNMRDLFRLVLVDTPLAPYFSDNLTSEDLDEMNIEVRAGRAHGAAAAGRVHAAGMLWALRRDGEACRQLLMWAPMRRCCDQGAGRCGTAAHARGRVNRACSSAGVAQPPASPCCKRTLASPPSPTPGAGDAQHAVQGVPRRLCRVCAPPGRHHGRGHGRAAVV
jgi:hypothetical protein